MINVLFLCFLTGALKKLMMKIAQNLVSFNKSTRYNSKLDHMRMKAVLSHDMWVASLKGKYSLLRPTTRVKS